VVGSLDLVGELGVDVNDVVNVQKLVDEQLLQQVRQVKKVFEKSTSSLGSRRPDPRCRRIRANGGEHLIRPRVRWWSSGRNHSRRSHSGRYSKQNRRTSRMSERQRCRLYEGPAHVKARREASSPSRGLGAVRDQVSLGGRTPIGGERALTGGQPARHAYR